MRVTMVGHSTVILEGAGTRLLTDPYFGSFGNLAYARLAPPSMSRDDVGPVDGVLVSHGHWDHTDRKFLRGLDARVPILVPAGTSFVMRLKGVRNAIPMKPWESRMVGSASITAVPAVHIARTAGYVVEMDGVTAYFAGDTYHRPFMSEIARRFHIDVALMPVATFRIPPTMGEGGAVAAVRDIRPSTVIPIHLDIQPRSPLLRSGQSAAGFARRLREAGLTAEVVPLAEGEAWESRAALASQARISA